MIIRELLRDIRRYKWRSIAVILSISIGISILSLISNMSASMTATEEFINSKYITHDISIWFNTFYPIELLDEIRGIEGVKIVEPRLFVYGSSLKGNRTLGIRIWGAPRKPKINTVITDNNSVWDLFYGNVCIIDEAMAKRAELKEGDNLTVYTSFGKLMFRIIALVDMRWSISFSNPINLDILVPIETLQKTLKTSNKANVIYVKVDSEYSIEEVYENIVNYLKDRGYKPYGWYRKETSSSLLEGSISIVFGIIFLPAIIIAGTLLSSVLLNKVAGEYRFIGIRKAIGFTPWQIFNLILLNGLFLFILSIPISILFSLLMTYIAVQILIKTFIAEVVIQIDLMGFLNSIFISFILVSSFTLYPAWKAKNVKPLDAIRWGFEAIKYRGKGDSTRLPKLFAMAWRNLSRRKKRSTLMILALIISCSAATSIGILTDSIYNTYVTSIRTSYKSDAEIWFNRLINSSDVLKVNQISGVARAEGLFTFYISPKNLSFIVNERNISVGRLYAWPLIRFIHPDNQLYRPEIVRGTWIKNTKDIIVSYKVAKYAKIKVGDFIRIRYIGTNWQVEINGTVVGIGQMLWQNGWEFIAHIENAYASNIIPEDHFNELSVKIEDGYELDEIIDEIFSVLKDRVPSSVMVTRDLVEGLDEFLSAVEGFLRVIVISTILVVIIGFVSGFIMIINERRWDIGLLKSIGGTSVDIIKIFLYEAIIIASVAAPIGLLIGVFLATTFASMINTTDFPLIVYPIYRMLTITINIFLPFIITLTSIIPVLYMSIRIKPVKLLQELF